MLDRARAKSRRQRWENVDFLRLVAVHLPREVLREANVLSPGDRIDAAVCTLGLSVGVESQRSLALIEHTSSANRAGFSPWTLWPLSTSTSRTSLINDAIR